MTSKRHNVAISSSFITKHHFFLSHHRLLLPSVKAIPQVTVKEAIGLMNDDGATVREPAERLKISKSTAERIRLQEKENIGERQRGRPRKISAEVHVVQHLKLNTKRGILKAAVEAKAEANQLLKRPVSVITVRRRLRSRVARQNAHQKTYSENEHIKGRLHLVKKYKEWTEDDWA